MQPWLTADSLYRAVYNTLEQMQRQHPLEWQTEQQCLIAIRALRIHQSMRLEEVLTTTAMEVRALLQADRVLIYQCLAEGSGSIVAESVTDSRPSALEWPVQAAWFQRDNTIPVHSVEHWAIQTPDQAHLPPGYREWLTQGEVQASLVVPIPGVEAEVSDRALQPIPAGPHDAALESPPELPPWGLLMVHHGDRHPWPSVELELLEQLLPQIAIAIHRASAYGQLQRELEHRKPPEQLHRAMAERRLAETLLKVSQTRFQKLAANIPGIIYQYLLRPDGTDAIPYVSHGLRELCGLEPGVVMQDSRHGWECIHPEDRARLTATLAESGRSLQPWHQEFRIVTVAGQVKWVEANARPEQRADGSVLWDGLLIDVSDRNAAEEALRLSEARLQAILDNSKTIVYLKDIEGRYLLVNRAGEHLFQKSTHEVIGKTLPEILPLDVAEVMQQHDNQVIETGSSLEFEEQVPQPDGLHVYLAVKFPLLDGKGQIYAIGGICTDITERKRVELGVQQALEQEKELNQLKSRFISMASHEFRTPLTVISSSSGILDHYASQLNPNQRQRHFERIQSSVNHMTQLLDNVLMISKADANALEFQPVPIDLVDFGCQVMDEIQFGHPDHSLRFQPQQPSSQSHPTPLPSPQLWGQFDPKLLRQIFTHLLMNAIQYSSPASTVDMSLAREGDRAVIKVRDQGIGIPLADQPRLFEAFHRASNVGTIPGTGLGLTIARKCVELHGGTITVTSQVNRGTLVTVEMPLNATPT